MQFFGKEPAGVPLGSAACLSHFAEGMQRIFSASPQPFSARLPVSDKKAACGLLHFYKETLSDKPCPKDVEKGAMTG